MADIPRIKGNIAKMIAQNAPEADIDAYVASEGVSLDDLRKPAAPVLDKYQQAAVEERDALKAKGIDTGAGLTRRLAQGASFNMADEILAGLSTPLEMLKRGTFSPREGYNYAKAREDLIMDDARKNTGALGTVAEIGGGVGSGLGAARAGLSFARGLAPEAGLLARSAASAGDSAAFGAVAGAGEGNSLTERLKSGLLGGAVGAGVGALAPGAVSLIGQAVSPIVSNIKARVNPEGYARGQVSRAIQESGRSAREIGQDLVDASAAGQPYMLADALGNSGQRMLSTVARSPGEGRTAVVNALEGRQAGQGQRVTGIVDEALGSGNTARQTVDDLTQQARQNSAPLYQEALSRRPVWNERLQQFFDDPVAQRGLREGVAVQRLEALAEGRPFRPHDYAITGFNEAGDPILSGVPNMRTINLLKKGWDNILEGYRDGTTGRLNLDEYGRALDSVRRSFLREVDSVNPTYGAARREFAGPAQVRDAVRAGSDAANRGRAADNIARFEAMTAPSQQGYRIGYADTLAARAEKGAMGVNKARPLTSDKAQDELSALSLHQGPVQPGQLDPMNRRLAREQTMFETRNQALGGSRTADNLADAEAMGINPTLVGQLLSGNWSGALRSTLAAGQNALTGNTAQVRQAVADILLQRGANMNPAALQRMVDEATRRIQQLQQIARATGRGAAGGLAVATPAQNRK
ncbi:hypothetical protein [Bradyrhizobium sp. SZCCHNRI1073]|uniref:hypothetical protein n=1 Tax=Bradyrhizobium sp. SZCCHNRI1073 TaxID=3057280 RepID=UPI0029164D29|nr:hypothetical protein [Bradyrhizobium sp. SZCCHNRI1073]